MGGIYCIKNKEEERYYIGSSMFPDKRLLEHKNQLIDKKHPNFELQKDFSKFGAESFEFSILEDNIKEHDLKIKEQEYVNKLKSKLFGYNTSKNKSFYHKKNNENYKNVKIDHDLHYQLKLVSSEIGINIGKLTELGIIKIIESYKTGEFDRLRSEYTPVRRDGSFSRNIER